MRQTNDILCSNGGVREFIKADVGPADFETRLLTSLLHSTRPTNSVSSSLDQSRGFGDASAPTGDETLLASDAEAPSPSSDANEERPQADTLKQMLSARDKGKGKAVDSEEEARIATKVAAAHAQLTRIRGEKAERERILKHVKQDQIDRRKREQDGREAKQQTANASGSTSSIIASSGWKNRSAEEVRVSVRIFDGTSLRRKFSTSQSIQADVRPWIDASRPDGSAPYTLKQILTPQPSRAIEFSEETETLGNLINVGTTANLVMVPVKAYTDAYTSSAPVLAMRGASTAYGLFSGAIGKAMRTFGAGLGYPQEPTSSDNTDGPSSAASDSKGSTIAANQGTSRPGGMNIRTPADHQQYEDDRQFYNGNQVSRTGLVRLCPICSNSMSIDKF